MEKSQWMDVETKKVIQKHLCFFLKLEVIRILWVGQLLKE